MIITVADDIEIRQESFGAILFHKRKGTMIEVDTEAYDFIRQLKEAEIMDILALEEESASEELRLFLRQMINEEFFIELPAGILTKKDFVYRKTGTILPDKPHHLSAPETVHLAVTFRCENGCRDCYIERHKHQIKAEMSTKELQMVIDKISDFGVFQIAIGGGEPLIRDDMKEILSYASKRGLIIHLTSGKHDIAEKMMADIEKYLTVLQIGIRNEELLETQGKDIEKLRRIVDFMKKRKTTVGANVIIDAYGIEHFDEIIKTLAIIGFQTITSLRYKPSVDKESWNRHVPSYCQMKKFQRLLTKCIQSYPSITFRIDCSFAFLEKNLEEAIAKQKGIRGCVAGSRIVSIAPDGTVYPCSQLVGNDYCAGNLLVQPLAEIWEKSKILTNYRNYRTSEAFQNGACGTCRAKEYCGGCQVFGKDAGGAEKYCVEEMICYENN